MVQQLGGVPFFGVLTQSQTGHHKNSPHGVLKAPRSTLHRGLLLLLILVDVHVPLLVVFDLSRMESRCAKRKHSKTGEEGHCC